MEFKVIPIDKIRPSPFQPREAFSKEEIEELAESIKGSDLVHPILVRKKGDTYEIIAGERRWRAAQFVGLKELPAIIREAVDIEARELSLIENWHRLNLRTREAEDFVVSLWIDGKSSGKYKNLPDMSRKTGIPVRTLSSLISAHEDRKEIGIDADVSYQDIERTRVLKEEPELRKKVLELRAKEEIRAVDLRGFSEAVKEASPTVREALLRRDISADEARAVDVELITPNEKAQVIEYVKRERSPEHVRSWVDFIKSRDERKDIMAQIVETATGDIWICPICNKRFRLIHVEPLGAHQFEEIKE